MVNGPGRMAKNRAPPNNIRKNPNLLPESPPDGIEPVPMLGSRGDTGANRAGRKTPLCQETQVVVEQTSLRIRSIEPVVVADLVHVCAVCRILGQNFASKHEDAININFTYSYRYYILLM